MFNSSACFICMHEFNMDNMDNIDNVHLYYLFSELLLKFIRLGLGRLGLGRL
jgi:hypothetical protein